MLDGWMSLFRPHILERGLNYYESGAVEAVEQTANGYRGRVAGTEEYEVEIEIKDGRIHDMYCDCPYAADGNYCKHMAAVLYEIEEMEPGRKGGQIREEGGLNPGKELRDVIDGIPEEELRNLLETVALKDNRLCVRILTKYSKKMCIRDRPSSMSARCPSTLSALLW